MGINKKSIYVAVNEQRDPGGKLFAYGLLGMSGDIKTVGLSKLKIEVQHGESEVLNLSLKGNRLYGKVVTVQKGVEMLYNYGLYGKLSDFKVTDEEDLVTVVDVHEIFGQIKSFVNSNNISIVVHGHCANDKISRLVDRAKTLGGHVLKFTEYSVVISKDSIIILCKNNPLFTHCIDSTALNLYAGGFNGNFLKLQRIEFNNVKFMNLNPIKNYVNPYFGFGLLKFTGCKFTYFTRLLCGMHKIQAVKFENSTISGSTGDMSAMFKNCGDMQYISLGNLETLAHPKTVAEMFYGCTMLISIDLNKMDMSKCKNISCMFYTAIKLQELHIENWDTRNLQFMEFFLAQTSVSKLDLSNWDMSNIIVMNGAFSGCARQYKLVHKTSRYLPDNEYKSIKINWNTMKKLYQANSCFAHIEADTLDLSNWTVASREERVSNSELQAMFNCAIIGKLYLNNIDFSKCVLNRIFDGAKIGEVYVAKEHVDILKKQIASGEDVSIGKVIGV